MDCTFTPDVLSLKNMRKMRADSTKYFLFFTGILLFVSVVTVLPGSLHAYTDEILYGGTKPMFMNPANKSVFVDLRDVPRADIYFRKESNKKSITDFDDFLRNTRNVYFTLWLVRIVQVNMMDINNKDKQVLVNPFRMWKNFFGFQNKNDRRGDFEWKDGDRFKTNWVAHPIFGAYSYLYYRAKGYNRYTAALGSVVQSTLFEYTIEGAIQSPSMHDLIITPGVGVPVGIVLEETSTWLASRQSGFLNAMSYVVNPVKIILPDEDNINMTPILTGQIVIGFQW